MKSIPSITTVMRLAVALAVGSFAIKVTARPYATCLTNSGSSISFRLNESADNVKIVSGAGAVTNDLGPLPQGLTVANLTIAGVFKVQVTKSSGPGYLQGVVNQISDDTNNFVKFANQRGVAINKNTNSPYFGRIYVSVSAPGTSAGRAVGDGIYVLNADQTDALGQGDAPLTGGVNGGLGFDAFVANSESPGRIVVGPDDNLYITDWSDPHGGLYVTDPNVATNAVATNVLAFLGGPSTATNNHGSMSAVWIEGSLAGGNLTVYTQDEDLVPKNGVWRYDIGSGPLAYTGPGTLAFQFGINSQWSDLVRGPDGKWYGSNRRAEFATVAGVFVLSEDGSTVLWNSINEWRNFLVDPSFPRDSYFGETRGIDVSVDGKYLVAIRGATNNPTSAYIPPSVGANTVLILPLENGVPNFATLIVMPTTPYTAIGRDIGFDAAGNIHTVSSGQGLLRIYSPGGFSIATTGSDGTFDIFVPSVNVSVAAMDNSASEAGDTAQYTISRVSTDISQPLPVQFNIIGTASNGLDYLLQTNSVTLTGSEVLIPAGATEVVVTLVPTDDSVAEPTETATVGIAPNANYTVASGGATAAIVDNETPQLQIANSSATIYERLGYDYAVFRITRFGDTNAPTLTVDFANVVGSGTASSNVDYSLANLPLLVNPGDITVDVPLIAPTDDSLVEGTEIVTLGLAAGSGYTAATNAGSITIVDDDQPAESVLFSENFNISGAATNWAVYYASTNPADGDYVATFSYDYAALGIPSAPRSTADTLGLFLTVNKLDGIPGAGALNLYPTNRSFSGNYAMRFDMYLVLNSGGATTEYALFGINHDGAHTNWFRNTTPPTGIAPGWTFDGLWYGVEADGAALGDYVLYSSPTTSGNNPTALASRSASTLTGVFKDPPFGAPGAPSNDSTSPTPSWADVEISQIGNIVTLKINNTVIFSHNNTGPYRNGTVLLGYTDAYDSIPTGEGAVIYDNLRVISLDTIRITSFNLVGNNVQVDFAWPLNDEPSAFRLQSATSVTGAYTDDTSATITVLSPASSYRATTVASGGTRFYRVVHK